MKFVTQLTVLVWCLGFYFVFTEENVELEKAREEWEALENIQPGQIYLAVLPVWILIVIVI